MSEAGAAFRNDTGVRLLLMPCTQVQCTFKATLQALGIVLVCTSREPSVLSWSLSCGRNRLPQSIRMHFRFQKLPGCAGDVCKTVELHLHGGAASEHTVARFAEPLHGGPLSRFAGQERYKGVADHPQLPLVHWSHACALPWQLPPMLALDAVHHLHARGSS